MRKSITKVLATTLVVTMLVPSVGVGAYTFNKKENNDAYVVSEISKESLEKIREYAVSDIVMLDDIVERSYNNDFQNKNYIIKTKGSELKRTINLEEEFGVNVDDVYGDGYSEDYDLWGNYLKSRGDTYIGATFNETNVIRDEENDCYYHSVSVTSKPVWDAMGGFFDFETRKLTKYDEYIKNIEQAEKEIGFVKGNNLCDFQLIDQVYVWIKDHVKDGGNIEYNSHLGEKGQTAIGCVTGDPSHWKGKCAGQSRLFNRFMHDMGIDSYWTSYPSITHSFNRVRLSNNYYGVDCQSRNYDSIGYSKGQYGFPTFLCEIDITGKEYFFKNCIEIFSDMYYNKEYKNQSDKSWEDINMPGLIGGHTNSKLKSTNSMFHFEDENWVCPYCTYTGNTKDATHTFEDTGEISDKRVKLDESKIVPSAGFEVYDRKLDSNGNDLPDCFKVFIDGKDVSVEKNPEETTTGDNEVEKDTTAPDYSEPTTDYVNETSTRISPTENITSSSNNESTSIQEIVIPITSKTETKSTQLTTNITTRKETQYTSADRQDSLKKATPSKVKKVKIKKKSKKSIKLTWKRIQVAKAYQIQYSTSKSFKSKVKTKTTKKISYTVKKLVTGKTYYIRVRGINGKQVGKWSAIKKVEFKNTHKYSKSGGNIPLLLF